MLNFKYASQEFSAWDKLQSMWNEKKIVGFRRELLRWYRLHRRDLPWRNTRDPYRIWISEIMLQQTQTSAVLPYYERFLESFPNIRSLAQAPESEVLKAWSGLGYYTRARNLHQAARRIVQSDGAFPCDFRTVLHLPGIGRYTAGAICSIAFNQPFPVVDGNVRRVLARLMAIENRVPERFFWNVMSAWISRKVPSNFNQAMMELGALVCTSSQPKCPQCPVREFCNARKSGMESEIPKVRNRKVSRRVEIVIIVIERNGKILLAPSSKSSFIPGLWELPWQIIHDHVSKGESAAALCRDILGQDIPLVFCGNIRHSISVRQITGSAFCARIAKSGLPARRRLRWANPSSLGGLLTSSIFHKVLRQAQATGFLGKH
jgi:A/G-specific adenine glycosylase